MTYTEYMFFNPDVIIIGGKSLDHYMEFDERTGYEACSECDQDETELDDVCPDSPSATFLNHEWEDYVEVAPGVARWAASQTRLERRLRSRGLPVLWRDDINKNVN
mgnify:CR=1 FL=1|jgi:hypothetical protein